MYFIMWYPCKIKSTSKELVSPFSFYKKKLLNQEVLYDSGRGENGKKKTTTKLLVYASAGGS